jgi:hypothetical protein
MVFNMRNRFGGYCMNCGQWIPPMKGKTVYKDKKLGKWLIEHRRGCPPHKHEIRRELP